MPSFLVKSYMFGTMATLIKTIAWWINQWPSIVNWSFEEKWMLSAACAFMEYAPLTFAMSTANENNVHMGLLTSYMEVADNIFRMLQQLSLSKSLNW